MRVRCVTINLRGLELGWFEWRSAALTRGLRPLEPDVLCLQEVALRRDAPPYDQPRAIGESLGLPHCEFSFYENPRPETSRDHAGVAIVSRWRILQARERRLQSGHDFPFIVARQFWRSPEFCPKIP